MRNFGEVIPSRLWRSGKYSARELMQAVNEHNIKLVIDLRDRPQLLADSTYRRIGVSFINFPVNEYQGLPKNALDIWDKKTPALIHCWKGAHRTGAWVARLRIKYCGWSRAQALDEMLRFGFGNISLHSQLFVSVFNNESCAI